MSLYEDIKENLIAQVHELEALQSVYPKELDIVDYGVLADINDFIENPKKELPQKLEYTIRISINEGILELQICLPTNYPKEKPEVYARTSLLDRAQQFALNKALNNFLHDNEEGEPCIYSLISWLQDNTETYLKASNIINEKNSEDKQKQEKENTSKFARYWIYSHHIYNKLKRRNVINLANENSLTGFCLAGKPGIICIEGDSEDCEDFWQKVKVMNWHKILVKLIEDQVIGNRENINSLRKYSDFKEISFPSLDRHNDMGQLLNYLTKHQSQHIFKHLFGIEGKSTIIT